MPRILRVSELEQFAAINLLSDPGYIGGPVVIPNCVQARLRWTLPGGKTAYNVLYGRAAGIPAPTAAQATALHQAMSTGAAWTSIASALPTTVGFAGVDLRSVHGPSQALVQSTSPSVPGTATGEALPNEVAICVTLRTALAGAQNRGRLYLPGWAASTLTTGNVFSSGLQNFINTWVGGFISIFSGQGYTWVIGQPARAAYTGSTGTQHPARTATSQPIISAVCRNVTWDSQRRRGLK